MQDTQWSIKVVEKSSRRPLRCVYKGSELSEDDCALMRDALTMRTLLLADLVAGPSAKVVVQWERTVLGISYLDVELYAQSWSLLKEAFLDETAGLIKTQPEEQLRDFKHRVARTIPYKWIANAMADLLAEKVPIDLLIQWIVFDEKLNLRSLDLSSEMVESYLKDEEELRCRDYTDLPADFIDLCQMVARDFEAGAYPFRPKHGPGATAETDRRHSSWRDKNLHLKIDGQIDQYLYRRYVDAEGDHDHWFFGGRTDACNDVAELVCVPKSMIKNRTISKEPVTRQYLQQDIFAALDDWFSHHPILKDHIDLHDQGCSRDLAREGSASGAYSTIDLSKASDTVTCSLLEVLFRDTSLLDCILSTRSKYCKVSPTGPVIRLEKIAGMGNAICFPVECLVFCLCSEYACRAAGTANTTKYRVFGDDIVIPTEAVPFLFDILEKCGFVVNKSKSFYARSQPCFREACGIWAIDGRDVTPLRLSRRLVSPRRLTDAEAPQAAGVLALANESFRYGLMNLNRGIHSMIRKYSWYPGVFRVAYGSEKEPWVNIPSPYLLTWEGNDTQWRVYERWSRKSQQRMYNCCVFRARARCAPGDENDLFSYWVQKLNSDDSGMSGLGDSPDSPITDREFNTAGSLPLAWGRKWVASN